MQFRFFLPNKRGSKASEKELMVDFHSGLLRSQYQAQVSRFAAFTMAAATAAVAAAINVLRHRQEQHLRNSRGAAAEFEQGEPWRWPITTHNPIGGLEQQTGDGVMLNREPNRELGMKAVVNEAIARRNIAEATSRSNDRDNKNLLLCRICHVNAPITATLVNLGCECKLQLSRAHTSCAQKWFRLKGNTLCEICKKVARNVQIPFPPSPGTTPSLPHRSSLPPPVATPPFLPSLPNRSSFCVNRQQEEIQDFADSYCNFVNNQRGENTEIEELYNHSHRCRSIRKWILFGAVNLLFLVLGTILGLLLRNHLHMHHY